MNPTQARAILGLAANAGEQDIKQAFKRAASQHHPDKGGTAHGFQQARDAADALLAALHQPHAHTVHIRRRAKNPSINITVSIDPVLLFADYTTTVCLNAAGQTLYRTITVPRFTANNQRMIFHSLGLELSSAAEPGDLVVTVHHSPASQWRVAGNELHIEVDICVFDAIIGSTTRISHPTGVKIDVAVPSGSINGQRLRIAGLGYGDNAPLIVTLRTHVPQLTAEQIKQLASFKLSL